MNKRYKKQTNKFKFDSYFFMPNILLDFLKPNKEKIIYFAVLLFIVTFLSFIISIFPHIEFGSIIDVIIGFIMQFVLTIIAFLALGLVVAIDIIIGSLGLTEIYYTHFSGAIISWVISALICCYLWACIFTGVDKKFKQKIKIPAIALFFIIIFIIDICLFLPFYLAK